ncbi:MAG: hypothetical protein V1709_07060 [Planctomycetota bacterium]
MKTKPEPYLSDEDYHKLLIKLRMQFNGVFDPYHIHGLDIYVLGSVDECVKLAEDFGEVLRGVDKPLSLEIVKKSLSKKKVKK